MYPGCIRLVNQMESMSRTAGFFAEQRTRQKSGPHDTKAVDVSVALAVIRAEVVPILRACHLNADASTDVSHSKFTS